MELKNKASIYDLNISKQVNELKEEYNITNTVLRGVLGGISISGVGELLANRNAWSARQVALVAKWFGVTTDQLIFNDKNFISKLTVSHKKEAVKFIRDFLIKEGNTNTLGKLTADGFFDVLNK